MDMNNVLALGFMVIALEILFFNMVPVIQQLYTVLTSPKIISNTFVLNDTTKVTQFNMTDGYRQYYCIAHESWGNCFVMFNPK